MSLELDFMEYNSDAAAQAAYPSSDTAIDAFTKLLLHCNGIDESTDFPDSSPSNHNMTAQADAQVDTAQKEFGTGSLLLDGIGDYLSALDSVDWDFGNGDFTIDFWIRFNAITGGYTTIAGQYDWSGGATNCSWLALVWNAGLMFAYTTDGAFNNQTLLSVGWSPSTATWYHVAIVRNGADLKFFVDGTQQGATKNISTDTIFNSTRALGIGGGIATYINGWFDEFRISKGLARWTANFTPPVREYTQPLQCYSESAIKEQGSYSLAGQAYKTSSLNDYLERTIGSPIDLSGKSMIKFDIRASRTGTNIKIGIHDSGGQWTEITPNILSVDTWQVVEWDISGVADADKDAIDKIRITIVNAD